MIYVFMADGTEEVEAVATIDMLRRAELDVMTLGIGSQMIVGSHGIGLVCDADAKNIEPDETMQAVVIPGGMPGTLNIEKSTVAQKFIDYAAEKGIIWYPDRWKTLYNGLRRRIEEGSFVRNDGTKNLHSPQTGNAVFLALYKLIMTRAAVRTG
jgi:hypothetical protein